MSPLAVPNNPAGGYLAAAALQSELDFIAYEGRRPEAHRNRFRAHASRFTEVALVLPQLLLPLPLPHIFMSRYARRRRAPRRTYRGRRRNTRRSRRRVLRRGSVNMHNFIRREGIGLRTLTINTNATGQAFFGVFFRLSNTTNASELTQLYDSYRINAVTVTMSWNPESGVVVPANPANFPEFWYKRDYDDAVTPTSTTMFEQSNQTRIWRPTNSRTFKSFRIRPAVINTIGGDDGVFSSSMWRPWIDCSDANVPHYGLKIMVNGAASTNYGRLSLRVAYRVSCKNVR